MASVTDLDKPRRAQPFRLIPLKAKVVLAALGVALVGFLGYGIGTDRAGSSAHVLTGRAYVTPYQVSVTVHGWVYGFEITPDGMHWYDDAGLHEGGIPACLQHPGNPWIRFGYAEAKGLHTESWRDITWVQCVDHA